MKKSFEKENIHVTPSRCIRVEEAKRIFALFDQIDIYAGEISGIFDKLKESKEVVGFEKLRKDLRNWWYDNASSFIDEFLKAKGNGLTEADRQLVLSWKRRLHGTFICLKFYKSYAVFSKIDETDKLYAVHGLYDDFDVVLEGQPPILVDTGLLPYNDIIIWDGLVGLYGMSFGNNIKKVIHDEVVGKKNNLTHRLA